MHLLKRASLLISGMLFSVSITAGTQIESQRERYLDTLEAARSGQSAVVEAALPQLADYPLLPYIQYAIATQQLKKLSIDDVESTLDKLQGTPLYQRFLHVWAVSLTEDRRWPEFYDYYARIRTPSAQLECLAARGEMLLGNTEKAFTEGARLWSTGNSQHAACDSLFNAMIQAGKVDSSLALERVLLALESDNTGIARYAERFVTDPAAQQQLALIWQLYNQPASLADNPNLLRPQTPNRARLASMAIQRLARDDLRRALLTWSQLTQNLSLSDAEQAPIANRLGVLYAKRFQPDAETVLAQVDPQYRFSDVTEWRIRLALIEQNWSRVETLISHLPDDVRLQGRWLYWALVADLQRGRQPNAEQLALLTSERSYYGFKAAELTQRPFALNNQPANFNQTQKQQIAQLPAMQRIHEFYRLGQTREATQEWNLMTTTLSPEQIHVAAHVIKDWGWYFQGIRGAIASDRWDDLELRFPAPYRELFDQATREFSIEPSWALAVTRQESAFLDVARSGAGARGLMQLMPATAQETARRADIPLSSLERLNDPDINVRLGSAYLAQMQRQFNGNRVHATAAYNAGPGRVRQWLAARGDLPLDIWIETIPFDETRGYVLNVLSFGVIYNTLAGQPARVFSDQERSMLAWSNPGR
ncbi:MAG: transglycosylase SLT domain-containing protein [Nitrincola lacisaponensis]|uniref:transglycosylase SLT domain-containing protein n=1 Tax=Nitrincola lacisaponensis TaxID=267850 RepID=UPI00391DA563